MKYTDKEFAAKWVDDYLDLYNFAVTIGDTEWQRQILQTLRTKDHHISLEIEQELRMDLWLRFDSINRKMLELYEQLRSKQNSEEEKRYLTEKMWEFKLQRVRVAGILRAHYVLHGDQ